VTDQQPDSSFGELLRRLRADRELTQEELAGLAGLSPRTVSDLERGVNRTGRRQTVSLLADALELTGHARVEFEARGHGRSLPGPCRPARSSESLKTRRLIGRDDEIAALVRLIEEAFAGRGGTVQVEGEPGIGKSTLVRTALARTADSGCQVFWAAGDELGQAFPLLPFIEGLRVREISANRRRKTILRLLRGEHTSGHGMDVPAVLAEQLLALVADECAVRPTILVIDDLQWADQASIALWERLAQSARRAPLLLIGMARPVPRRDDLLVLRRALGNAARIQLTGLTNASVGELLEALLGGKPDHDLLQLADGASGNPLYITELVAALNRGSGVTITDAGTVMLTNDPVPDSLSAAIADRLSFLSADTRPTVEAAALLGVDFAVPDLAVVRNSGVAGLIPAITEACAAGVLAESGGGLKFRHPLIHAALYDSMPAALRAAWHCDAGRALAEAGAPVDRVARQLLQALQDPATVETASQWMVDWLAHTAGPLVARAPGVAVQLLRWAVASAPASASQYAGLEARLAEALYRMGEATESEQVATRALARATDPDLFVDLHWTLGQVRIRLGRFAECLEALNETAAFPGISDRHRARLLVLAARTHDNVGDAETAGQVATTAFALASEAGDAWAMAWALHVLTTVVAGQGRLTDVLSLCDQALRVTGADPALTDLRLLLQINKAIMLGEMDRYEEAFATAWQARELAHEVGTVIRLVQAHSALGQLLFDTGRWDEALTEVEALPVDLKEPIAACCDLGVAAVIRFHRGEADVARRLRSGAGPHARRTGVQTISPLALARSLDLELTGALPDALAALSADSADDGKKFAERENLLADAVRLAVKTGDLGTACAITSHAEAIAAGSEVSHQRANALFCSGLLERDATRLLVAADRYNSVGRPLLRAKALEAAAAHLAAPGNYEQARAVYAEAIELYASLGAIADVTRLRAADSYEREARNEKGMR
jgi:transcriptional regulator with XRE-family HTH domain/tetratricopeptide (TPR) repeat protein